MPHVSVIRETMSREARPCRGPGSPSTAKVAGCVTTDGAAVIILHRTLDSGCDAAPGDLQGSGTVHPNVFETANAGFAQALYEDFLRDPASVSPEWRRLFESGQVGERPVPNGNGVAAPSPVTNGSGVANTGTAGAAMSPG